MEQKEKDRKNMEQMEQKREPGEGIPLQDFKLLGMIEGANETKKVP